ncbi:hypothetical protein Agau_P100022 (plasmid) [Agrobacterium tumefaciens F2]|nr:hypothetical protein Agau_P100022 [Agrobacterium tumefaciens F2]
MALDIADCEAVGQLYDSHCAKAAAKNSTARMRREIFKRGFVMAVSRYPLE